MWLKHVNHESHFGRLLDPCAPKSLASRKLNMEPEHGHLEDFFLYYPVVFICFQVSMLIWEGILLRHAPTVCTEKALRCPPSCASPQLFLPPVLPPRSTSLLHRGASCARNNPSASTRSSLSPAIASRGELHPRGLPLKATKFIEILVYKYIYI